MGLNLNEATINEFGRFDELKKSVDKSKAKRSLKHMNKPSWIPPKVNMKTDQLLRQFILPVDLRLICRNECHHR